MKLWALQRQRKIADFEREPEPGAGVFPVHSERQSKEHPVPPEDYPASGSACYRCSGTRDPRCCQYSNQKWDVPE